MGKHPDPGDAKTIETRIPCLNAKGEVLWSIPIGDQSWAIDMASDGSKVACASKFGEQKYYMWDSRGKVIWEKSVPAASRALCLSPDNMYLLTGPDENRTSIVLYDAKTGSTVWKHRAEGWLRAAAFSKDGKYVFAGVGSCVYKLSLDGKKLWHVPCLMVMEKYYGVRNTGL